MRAKERARVNAQSREGVRYGVTSRAETLKWVNIRLVEKIFMCDGPLAKTAHWVSEAEAKAGHVVEIEGHKYVLAGENANGCKVYKHKNAGLPTPEVVPPTDTH